MATGGNDAAIIIPMFEKSLMAKKNASDEMLNEKGRWKTAHLHFRLEKNASE